MSAKQTAEIARWEHAHTLLDEAESPTPLRQMVNEGKSTSTVQNAENTVRMLKRMGATGAVIVTNDFHMDRALKNFRDAAKAQGARLVFRPAYA